MSERVKGHKARKREGLLDGERAFLNESEKKGENFKTWHSWKLELSPLSSLSGGVKRPPRLYTMSVSGRRGRV